MFPECRRLHEKLNSFNKSELQETGVIIVVKVVWISQKMVACIAGFPRVDAHRIGHFIQPFE